MSEIDEDGNPVHDKSGFGLTAITQIVANGILDAGDYSDADTVSQDIFGLSWEVRES